MQKMSEMMNSLSASRESIQEMKHMLERQLNSTFMTLVTTELNMRQQIQSLRGIDWC